MAIDENLLKVVAGKGRAAPTEEATPSEDAPVTSPMTTPNEDDGTKQEAIITVNIASKLLESTMLAFGTETAEAKAVMGALESLTKTFGETRDSSERLIPAELKVLMEKSGVRTPEQEAAAGPAMPGAAPMQMAA